jgi:hypothetical protein
MKIQPDDVAAYVAAMAIELAKREEGRASRAPSERSKGAHGTTRKGAGSHL